ncbi:MAG: hypothetical protein ACLSUT_03390 [Christensenellales bacterium]
MDETLSRTAKSGKRARRNSAQTAQASPTPVYMIAGIVERGKAGDFLEMLEKNGLYLSSVCMGQGTAGSEIMDILGLENSDKEIIVSLADRVRAKNMLTALNDRLDNFGSKGIAFMLRLNAAPNLIIKALENQPGKPNKEDKSQMDGEKYCLIVISVNQGYTDEVMSAAKKGGARGGTLLRARHVSAHEADGMLDFGFMPEREIIAIIAPKDKQRDIMEAINAEHGVRSESGAVIVSLAVEDIAKLS